MEDDMGRERIVNMIKDVEDKNFDGFKQKFDEEMSDRLDDEFESKTIQIFDRKEA